MAGCCCGDGLRQVPEERGYLRTVMCRNTFALRVLCDSERTRGITLPNRY
jgi:hypothetical protein